VSIAARPLADRTWERRPVLAQSEEVLLPGTHEPRDGGVDELLPERLVGGGDQDLDRLPAQLLPLVAEELLRLAARGADQALSVDDHGGIRGGLEEVVEETLAPAQALQRLFALPLGALERAPSLRVAQLALDRGAES
jgi:hypothetical protein